MYGAEITQKTLKKTQSTFLHQVKISENIYVNSLVKKNKMKINWSVYKLQGLYCRRSMQIILKH